MYTPSIKNLSSKLSYLYLLIKVFFEGKIIDYIENLVEEHMLNNVKKMMQNH